MEGGRQGEGDREKKRGDRHTVSLSQTNRLTDIHIETDIQKDTETDIQREIQTETDRQTETD